ncbi:Apoptosis-inducing factor 1 [Leucoagaricus sp. SymC.cos]|nr:Apoptosis-inducing factor 1 [Leucoagaricus sp. SymC.cos]
MVKTIAVLDESELKDGQLKEVDFESGKVLLSRLGDKIHATSAWCTHFGAPLSQGILSADGRLSCPWHGACWKVSTGDIEDAPAPAALHSFKVTTVDGKIHVTADPESTVKQNMKRNPRLLTEDTSFKTDLIIVGGGSGAFYAVESLREHGYKEPITILSKEPYAPIDRTKLSKALITDPAAIMWKTPADLKIKYGTTLRLGVEVTLVDPKNKAVTLDNGADTLSYEKLILAPGGIPRRLPIEGANLENVFTFRDISDSKRVDAAAQEGKRAVFIGSSFISMELVVALLKRKLASIDVIGMEEVPFEVVLGKEVGAGFKKYFESQGVKFHMQTKVEKIVAKEDDPKLAAGVVVNGQTLLADFVVMGVGVRPATDFLKGSGIDVEKDGGVRVDEFLRVKTGPDTENIYAIGDIAIYPQYRGTESHIEHWSVAGNQGRSAGKSIAGSPEPFTKIPFFWSTQSAQLRYCGISHKHDEVIVRGDPSQSKFVAYYVQGDRIVGVSSMQNDPVATKASELLRLGRMPSPATIKAGGDLFSVDISTANSLQ